MRKMINKSMRRLFAILLSALIMLSAVVPAVAAEDESSVPAGNSQTITEESKDESKTEDLVVEEPEDEEPKDEEPKDEEPEDEEPKDEELKDEEPKDEEPEDEEPKDEEPEDEEPKDEEPEDEEPEDEEPKDEEPEDKEPEAEEPKDEEPKDEEPKDEEPKDEGPKAEEPKAEEPKDEEPEDEEAKAEEKSLYEALMSAGSADEYKAILSEYSEEYRESYELELDKEQLASLHDKMIELGILHAYTGFSSYTKVGSMLWPAELIVPVQQNKNTRRLMAKRGSAANGIVVDKNPAQDPTDPNKYTITLEVYTTGQVTIQTEAQPVDIVLVLDTSGSMAEDITVGNKNNTEDLDILYGGAEGIYTLHRWLTECPMRYYNGRWQYRRILSGWTDLSETLTGNDITVTKENALKIAAQHFVDEVKTKAAEDGVEHRISVVRYASNASTLVGLTSVTTGETSIKNAIKGLNADGATGIDYGMKEAKPIIDSIPDAHGKVLIMFTDGEPTHGNTFSNEVANTAISQSKDMKQDGVTVYSVGVYEGSPSNNVRTFMDYFSSNYKNATSMTNGGAKTGDGYFLTAANAAEMTEIFTSIAHAIQTPTISLTQETLIQDIVTPQFSLPENTSKINVYTCESLGGENFATGRQDVSDDVAVDIDEATATVKVTGFNFNENFVSETPKDGANDYGRKLIIEFVINLSPDYLGGTALATNGPNSGVVGPDGNTVASFDVPHIDVPLKTIEPVAATWNVYASTEDQLANAFEQLQFTIDDGQPVDYDTIFDGINNAGADVEFDIKDSQGNVVYTYIIEAGKTAGSWQYGQIPTLTDEKYTITCKVMDHNNINNVKEAEAIINVNVFYPIFTFVDKNVYYKGQQIDIANVEPKGEIEWMHQTTSHKDVEMDTTEPGLSYTYEGVDDAEGTVDQTSDYTVAVTSIINNKGDEIVSNDVDLLTAYADQIAFKRDCTVESLTGADATAAEAFKIHVYTPAFTFNDDVKYYGEAYTLPTVNTSSIAWKNGTTAAPASMDNTAPAVAVTLTPTPETAFSGGYVQVTTDVPVKAVITLGGTDVTAALITAGKVTRTCTSEGETVPAATADTAFVVHVKTVSLTIKKSIEGAYADMTKTYSFNVSYSGNVDYSFAESTFTLGHNGEKELTGLPVGSVTVEESGVLEGYTVAFDLNSAPGNPKTPSEGKASETLTLTAGTEENTIVVHNTLATVPETGIRFNDGMSSALLLMIALGGMAAMAVLSVVKRFSGRAKLIRK